MVVQPKHILIVGAGPTGLTAAVELTRRGFRPRIVDAADGPTPLSKAVGISPHSLDILEQSGIAGKLLAEGIRIRRLAVFTGETRSARSTCRPSRNFLLSLPQADTETVMAETLEVAWRTRLKDMTQSATGVDVALANGAGSATDFSPSPGELCTPGFRGLRP